MSTKRSIGPRMGPGGGSGPRITSPQPTTPPTQVQLGNDRLLAGAREVDIDQIIPDPDQPRRSMDPARLAELAGSIERYGLLQPLVVRQAGMARDGDMRYVVIAGGRRYAAIRIALERASDAPSRQRLQRVPVVISQSPEAEQRVLQLIENLQREDLNPVEEARAFKEIMRIEGLTMDRLALRVHRSQGYVDERLRLLRHEEVEAAVEAGWLTKSAGAAIASIRSAEARRAWLGRAEAGETVRPREVYASKPNRRTGAAPSASGREERAGLPLPGNPASRPDTTREPGGDHGDRFPVTARPAVRRAASTSPPETVPEPLFPGERRAMLDLILLPADAAERARLRQVLAVGARWDLSCAELIAELSDRT